MSAASAPTAEPVQSTTLAGDVFEITLGAPPCNEIGTRMLEALEHAVAAAAASGARALVIGSCLDKGFCAGADLRELFAAVDGRPPGERLDELATFIDRVHALMDRLDELPSITVAAIHGVCFGGGLELALACDLRVADPSARFGFPELRLGLIPGFGGIPRLRRDAGEALVRDLVLTGRTLNAARAREAGIVSQVTGRGGALEAARQAARRAASFDPSAAVGAKRFIKRIPRAELLEEKRTFLELFRSPAVVEALRRFVSHAGPRPYL